MILISLSLFWLSLFSLLSLSYPRLCERTKRDKRDLACLIAFPHKKLRVPVGRCTLVKTEKTRTQTLSLSLSFRSKRKNRAI